MPILTQLREFLDRNQVPYDVVDHREAFTAQEVAEVEHIPGMELAKVVILRGGATYLMAVLPAPYRVDLDRAASTFGKKDLRLATEDEFKGLFPHCEPGAMPPFGNLFNLPVYVDQTLARDEQIVFNAGTHTQTVKMRYADFVRLVRPTVASFATR